MKKLWRRVLSGSLVLAFLLTLCPQWAAASGQPYVLTAADFAEATPCVKYFDWSNQGELETAIVINGETVVLKGKAKYSQKGAGLCSVTGTELYLSEEYSNYVLDDNFTTLVLEGEILPLRTAIRNGTVAVGEMLDLWSLVENAGTEIIDGGPTLNVEIVEPVDKLGCEEPLPDGTFIAGDRPGVLTLSASIPEVYWNEDNIPEFTGIETTFTITITDSEEEPAPEPPPAPQKLPQEQLVISGEREVTFGQTLQLSLTGGSTNGEVTWGLAEKGTGGEATISAEGLLTPVKAGTVWVTATMAGDDTYQEAKADAIQITIRQIPITITVGNKSALVGEEIPVLTASDCTVSGLLEGDQLAVPPTLTYETTPDMTREGEVAIVAAGASVPAGGYYDPDITYVPGKLTIGPVYPITIQEAEGGTVTADASQGAEGAVVTLQVQLEEGYVLDALKVMSGSTEIQVTEIGEEAYAFTMPDGGVVITPTFAQEVPETLPFTDVKEGDWFYESVAYVYFNGLMNGTSDTTFSPSGTTTRGMIVTILYRLAGSPEAPAWSPFQDVDPNQYYADPVAWAAWNGIVNGKTATAFAPNDPITREQMAAILYRYAQDQGLDVSQRGDLSQFGDQGNISTYAREALSWANGAGLITGKGGGVLDPQGLAVRAQVAAIFQRFCENFVS